MRQVLLGDCLELMQDIPDKSIDAVICDLPYGTTACAWDVVIPFDKLWQQYNRITKPNAAVVLFGQEPFSSLLRVSNLANYKYDWVWKKERLTNIFQVRRRPGKVLETISVFYGEQCKYFPQKTAHAGPLRGNKTGNSRFGKLSDAGEGRVTEYKDDRTRWPTQLLEFKRDILTSNLHPTQKPLALMEYLVSTYTEPQDLILDNCAGSGTTLLAASNLGRNFIGMEQDEKYYNVCLQRLGV